MANKSNNINWARAFSAQAQGPAQDPATVGTSIDTTAWLQAPAAMEPATAGPGLETSSGSTAWLQAPAAMDPATPILDEALRATEQEEWYVEPCEAPTAMDHPAPILDEALRATEQEAPDV